MKVLLSVGGWTYSQSGHFNFITDAGKRATFVSSAVQLVEDYGFDGIDIDFEFPSTDALASGFASLVSELRSAFDSLAQKKGDSVPYQITVRASHGLTLPSTILIGHLHRRPLPLLDSPTTRR